MKDIFSGQDLFEIESDLKTAVIISLFSDKRGDGDDVRGWWADSYHDDSIGSHLWKLSREKRTVEVLHRSEDYARSCLRWLIEDSFVISIDIEASFENDREILLSIALYLDVDIVENLNVRI